MSLTPFVQNANAEHEKEGENGEDNASKVEGADDSQGSKKTSECKIAKMDDLIHMRNFEPLGEFLGRERRQPAKDGEPNNKRHPRNRYSPKTRKSLQAYKYKPNGRPLSKQLVLGIDGGGTGTTWTLCEWDGHILIPKEHGKLGPGNMRLISRASLVTLLRGLPRKVDRVGLYLAGCVTDADRRDLLQIAQGIWKDAEIFAGSDRDSGYAAAFGHEDGIAVIAGTGSAITGRCGGREERAGGRGHLLGDAGGGYDLSLQALRMALFQYDCNQRIHPVVPDILHLLGLNTLNDLSTWIQGAPKDDVARLTPLLFRHTGEEEIATILRKGAETLAQLTAAVAKRLKMKSPMVRVAGGVFAHHAFYREAFRKALMELCGGASVTLTKGTPSVGAAWLATQAEHYVIGDGTTDAPDEGALVRATTEQMNLRSAHLDQMSPAELVRLFVDEERVVEEALRHCEKPLAKGVEAVAKALRKGGRLFYAGAGTSGRLGMLDASEIPPTFGQPPERVQAIMAGGATALQRSIEGAEDDVLAGKQSVADRGVRKGDVVCGLTASGRTPFVRGVLEAAKAKGCTTLLITCNPERDRGLLRADICIDLPTGAELLAGSTRLKAGTATKVALNILTTGAMVLLGHVKGNRMSHMVPSNAKLRQRAIHIVAETGNLSPAEAKMVLECANWNMPEALERTLGRRKSKSKVANT